MVIIRVTAVFILPVLNVMLLSCSGKMVRTPLVVEQKAATASPPLLTFNELRHAIVRIGELVDSGKVRWLGTGFLVDQKCTFVTAKHVVELANRDKIVIRFQLPEDLYKVRTLPARSLFEDPESDLAFLKIGLTEERSCDSGTLRVLPLAPEYPKSSEVGETIVIIGHPALVKGSDADIPILRIGSIASVEVATWGNKKMLLLDLIGVPGFSGSPVVIKNSGQVVGVVYGPWLVERGFGFEWATPITSIDYERATATKSP